MPSDDLVLNVRQISGYTATNPQPGDNLLLQRGGLGGPYLSVSAQDLVAVALAYGEGPAMGIGMAPPGDAAPAQAFLADLILPLEGANLWNAYFGGAGLARVSSGPAAAWGFDVNAGFNIQWAPPAGAGTPVALTELFAVSPTGYVTIVDQALLGRDPAAPLEAATAQWVEGVVAGLRAATVASFNGRTGAVCLWIQDILAAGGAPQFSPVFGGQPRAPTPAPWSCNSRLATTAFVHRNFIDGANKLLADHPFVFTFNGRSGDVVMTAADVDAALAGSPTAFAPLASPAFTGYPTAPTAAPGSITGQLATTAFVMNAVADSTTGVVSFNGRSGNVVLQGSDLTGVGGALLASPVFTGTPQAPTAPLGTNSAQIATTAFVMNALGGATSGVASFNGRSGAVTLNSTDISNAGGATTAYVNAAVAAAVVSFNGRTGAITLTANDLSAAGGAPLASPSFIGTPTGPTANPGTSTGQLATTAFVMTAIAAIGAGVTTFNGRAGAVTLTATDVSGAGGPFLAIAGGTLAGPLVMAAATAAPWNAINGPAGSTRILTGQTAGSLRWGLVLGDAGAESGSNAGSNFSLFRYSDTGAALSAALAINRATGNAVFSGTAAFSGAQFGADMWAGAASATLRTYAFSQSLGYNFTLDQSSGTLSYWANSVPVVTIGFNGNLTIDGVGSMPGGGPWASSSDARTKTEIAEYEQGLADVLELRPIIYEYRGNDAPPGGASPEQFAAKEHRRFVGMIAQEVEGVFPGMVTKIAGYIDGKPVSDLRQLNTGELVFALVNALKTLAARVSALEAAA